MTNSSSRSGASVVLDALCVLPPLAFLWACGLLGGISWWGALVGGVVVCTALWVASGLGWARKQYRIAKNFPYKGDIKAVSDRELLISIPPLQAALVATPAMELRRGQKPSGLSRLMAGLASSILNTSNVDSVRFGSEFRVVFKNPPSDQDMRLIYSAVEDEVWEQLAQVVRFTTPPPARRRHHDSRGQQGVRVRGPGLIQRCRPG